MYRYLIGKGADVNVYSGQGYTCLHQAALSDQPEIISLLISHGADVNAQDEEELSPLHVAARDGYGECVMLLVKAGANVRMVNCEKKTAKDLADMATEADTVAFLQSCENGLIPDKAPQKKVIISADILSLPSCLVIAGEGSDCTQGDCGPCRLGTRITGKTSSMKLLTTKPMIKI